MAHFWGGGYKTPAASGIVSALERGAKSELAHLWARWLRNPSRLGDPLRFRAGGEIRSGTLVGNVATLPLPPRGSQPLQSGRQNQKWPTCGQGGYKSPAASGILTASERQAKSEVAHLWARWLRNPCRLGKPLRFRAGAKSELAHLWARWLRNPFRLGDPHRLRAGGKITSGTLVGKVPTKPLPSRRSTPLESGGQNQKWPACGQGSYKTPDASGILTASERGAKSEVTRLWARWLCNPCRLGDPSASEWGQNQKWPTCGQSGYVTPAASGIPSA